MGYVSEDGVSFENSTTSIKAWGGDTPISIREDTVSLSLMQAKDPNVLELVYGPENVSTDGETGEITAMFAADYSLEGVFVFDMIMRGGAAKRIVVPKGSISEIGSVSYKDNEAVVYPVTIGCSPDAAGICHYEYTEVVLTIAGAVDACLGTVFGISKLSYDASIKEQEE